MRNPARTKDVETRAVLYRRVSTDEQAEHGHGLDAQLDACMALVEREDWVLAGEFADEGVSGAAALDRRAGLLAAIDALGRGDVLVVAKRDRLGRDALLMAMTEAAVVRKGARIVSAAGEGTESDEPTAVLMRRMVDAFAEYERLVIKARTRAALRAKARRGERVSGHIPYGFVLVADGVHLVEEPAEQAVIARARRFRAAGMPLRAVADELAGLGLVNRVGRKFGPRAVRGMVAA